MFCTAHHTPRPIPAQAELQRPADRRINATPATRKAPRQVFTDWASI
ncbi:MAG: hypothetical protein ACU0A9_09855 [Alterinioella nitratireducens]